MSEPLEYQVMQWHQLAAQCSIDRQLYRFRAVTLRDAAERSTSLSEASRLRAQAARCDQMVLRLIEERAQYDRDMKVERNLLMDFITLGVEDRCITRQDLSDRYQRLRAALDPERQVGITKRKKAERTLRRVAEAYQRVLATMPPESTRPRKEPR